MPRLVHVLQAREVLRKIIVSKPIMCRRSTSRGPLASLALIALCRYDTNMHNLIDTHFHLLEMKKRGIDPSSLLEDLFSAGFAGGIDIGVSENDLGEREPILDRFPSILRAAGIGPWGAQGEEPIEEIMLRFIAHTAGHRVDAIGEFGLDHHWNYGTGERQRDLCVAQMELAERSGLPVIIHTRDADGDMMDILSERAPSHGGIMHCFSSGWPLAERALEAGMYISFAGPITYKSNHALREVLSKVPIDRLLLETDSPYLSPEPFRGKTNTPFRMREIYAMAARTRMLPVEELAEAIKENFARLFPQTGR